MSTSETYTLLAFIYAVLAVLFYWFVFRVPHVQSRTLAGRVRATAVPSDGIPALLPESEAYAYRLIDADSPPVAVKFPSDSKSPVVVCKRVLVIKQCPDPMMWYANLIGKEVPYLGEWKNTREYRSREPAGYINIVKFDDATIIVKEVK